MMSTNVYRNRFTVPVFGDILGKDQKEGENCRWNEIQTSICHDELVRRDKEYLRKYYDVIL